MTRDAYKISLRVWHPTWTAQVICAAIPLEPSRIWTVGAPRATPKGAPLGGRYDETYCSFPVGKGVDELAVAIGCAADRLNPQCDVLREIRATGGRAELFVGWFLRTGNTGDVFAPDVLGRLADLGLALSFDLYGGLDEEPK